MSASPRAGCLPQIGGALALDFCNSTSGRGTASFVEHLFDHEDLLRWSVSHGVLAADAAAALDRRLAPGERARAFARAIAVRALLNRIFDAIAHRDPVDPADLAELSALAVDDARAASLEPVGASYAWRFAPADARPDGLVGPIVRSAVEVLTARDLARLKACPGEACGWVFLDGTKNASRVWCEMEVCGTRAKLNKRAAARRAGKPAAAAAAGQVSAAE